MATMVETPQAASVEVSNLQPVAKPEGSNLGSFLSGIAKAGAAEIGKYKDANASKNIALGMNDALNQVHREVSILDREYYNHGVSYQNVLSGQAQLQKKFQTDIDNMDVNNPDTEALFKTGREFMDNSVTNIFDSNLPQQLKEQLYETTLKENATYQKLINTKIQQVAADKEYQTRLDMTAMLARDLGTKQFTPVELTDQVDAFKEKIAAGMRATDPSVTMDDVTKEQGIRLKAAFVHTLQTLKASGQASDLTQLNYLKDVAQSVLGEDLDLSNYIQGEAVKYESEIFDNNDTFKSREVEAQLSEWELAPESFTLDAYNTFVANIAADESLSQGARTRFINQATSMYTSVNKKLLEAQSTDITLYDNPSDYQALGKSTDSWETDWVAKLLQTYPDRNEAGYQIMLKGGNGAEYSGGLVRKGSDLFFRSLVGYVSMTDSDAKADEFYGTRQENFSRAGQLYRAYKAQNGSKAVDMLSGIDPKYQDAFATVLENDGSLADVRAAFKDPIQMSTRSKNYDTAVGDRTNIKEALGLRKEILGGHGGTRFSNIADAIEDSYVGFVQEALLKSKSQLVPNVANADGISLMGKASDKILLRSANDYSSIIMPARARQAINRYTVEGSNTPINSQYIAKAIDKQREAIAKNYGVRPDNVIVMLDDTGTTAQFYAYETEGILGKTAKLKNGNDQGILTGGVVSMARIKKDAEGLLKQDGVRPAAQPQATRVGRSVVIDRTHSSTKGVGVKLNANYANAIGGNIDLGNELFNHFGVYEHFYSTPQTATDKNSGKVSTVWGAGITEAAMTPSERQQFAAARGDTQKIADLQGNFMAKYYKSMNINKDIQKAAIPIPNGGVYPPQYKRSLMLIYDVGWHGHNGGLNGTKTRKGVIDAMNAPTYDQGLAILRQTTVYDRTASENRNQRNKWMKESLRQHFKAMGKL